MQGDTVWSLGILGPQGRGLEDTELSAHALHQKPITLGFSRHALVLGFKHLDPSIPTAQVIFSFSKQRAGAGSAC